MGINGIRFLMAPNAIAHDLSISDKALRLYILLASHNNDWDVSISYVSKALKVSIPTSKKLIKELLNSGWITRVEKKKKSPTNGYKYTLKSRAKK